MNLFLIFLPILAAFGELIKLQDENQILCITDDIMSAIQILPPVVENSKDTSVFLDDDDDWKEWTLETSTDLVLPPVTDKRFEDFATTYSDHIYAPKVRSISFSVYASFVHMATSDVTKQEEIKSKSDLFLQWSTHSSYPIHKDSEFQFNATTEPEAYWKIHNYKVRSTSSVKEKANSIKLTNETTCIVIYLYICPTCRLNITAPGVQYSLHGYNDSDWKWDQYQLNGDPGAEITFTRAVDNEETTGQWVVDIRKCPETISSKAFYRVSLDEEPKKKLDRMCFLEKAGNLSNNIFACGTGIIGDKCDIDCETFLGNNSKSCEKNEICDQSFYGAECYCAWGYKGPGCNQKCDAGEYGLSCRNTCKCGNCDSPTEQCNNSASAHFVMRTLVMLLATLLLLK